MPLEKIRLYLPHAAWAVALTATAGSLYFSEVLGLPPCLLCWYQRIALYPLVAILLVGILRKDRGTAVYALPLIFFGLAVAAYHNLLYWQILPESAALCALGVSCTTAFLSWFGFATIPLLSLAAFALLAVLLTAHLYLSKRHGQR